MSERTLGSTRPAILFLAHLLPWPLDGGGQIKSYYTLRALASRYDVTLLAFARTPDEVQNAVPALAPFCAGGIKTVLIPRGKTRDAAIAARSVLTGQSFIIARDDVPAMRAEVEAELARKPYAALHVDHLQMAQFVPNAPKSGARVVLDQHNIEHRIPKRLGETPGASPLVRVYAKGEWKRLRDFEIAACHRADRVLTVSDEDAQGFAALASALASKITTVPIGVDTDYFNVRPRTEGSQTLVSIGTMYWPPNVDALLYFCAEVLPIIREAVPGARLNIVGARPVAAIRALDEGPNGAVHVTGSVPDVRPWADDCGAFVVPLRSGSGMRVKILNALAMGLPVVSTTVGAEGIEVTNGENILLADGAADFARAVVRVLTEPGLGDRLARNGRRLMDERYSWEVVGRRLLSVYNEIAPIGDETSDGADVVAVSTGREAATSAAGA